MTAPPQVQPAECPHCRGETYTVEDIYIPDHGYHATALDCWACEATGTAPTDPWGICACDDCARLPVPQRAGSADTTDQELADATTAWKQISA